MAQKVLYNDSGRVKEIALSSSSVDLGNVTNDAQIAKSIVTAKGDILTATANATPVRQGVGSNGQIIVADSNLTNGLGYKDPSFRNWVINGNFDIAQRGTSFTNPATGTYTIDRLKISSVADGGTLPTNIIHSQQLLTPGDLYGSRNFYRVSVDGAGASLGNNSRHIVYTGIEGGVGNLCGLNKKITVSFYARSSISSDKKIGIYLSPHYGTGGTPSSQEFLYGNNWILSSTWTKYSHTFTTNTLVNKIFGTDKNDVLYLGFFYQWGVSYSPYVNDSVAETFVGAGNIDIAQVALYAGDVAYPFEPVPFDIELQRCQRYFISDSLKYRVISAYNIGNAAGQLISFTNEMRIVPTITLYDAVGNINKITWSNSGGAATSNTTPGTIVGATKGFDFGAGAIGSSNGVAIFYYTADADF